MASQIEGFRWDLSMQLQELEKTVLMSTDDTDQNQKEMRIHNTPNIQDVAVQKKHQKVSLDES